jgi:large conductance mechanosensitive channel
VATSKSSKTVKQPTADDKVKAARAEARKAKTELVKARAEAARAKAKHVGVSQIGGFLGFIREKGVVGLAVGLAIGTAATGVVTQIVNSVITPTVSLLLGFFGIESLKALNFVAKRAIDGTPIVTYAVGDLIDALIKFLAVAAVIYFVVIGLKLDRLDKKKDA